MEILTSNVVGIMRDINRTTNAINISARTQRIVSGFSLPERLLLFFSKDPANVFSTGGYSKPTSQWDLSTALDELESAFPGFRSLLKEKRILDYGCGDGFQSVAMARKGATHVVGVDQAAERLQHAKRLAFGCPNVAFSNVIDGKFDIAISLNSFEHFPEPEKNLEELAAAIVPGGKILITFGSPWLSPYGSHMNFFTHLPWVNIIFSEKTVFNVRALYRDDGSCRYSPDMNKMTVKKFNKTLHTSGLKTLYLKYETIKNLPLVDKIPGVRELFINRISCVLTR